MTVSNGGRPPGNDGHDASSSAPRDLTLDELEMRLRAAFAAPLPGIEAQLSLAPRPRPGWPLPEVPPGTRTAAALILLYPNPVEPHLVLTLRADRLPLHPGQVSLPGGAVEADETVETAALREAHEEIGVYPRSVHLLGALTPLHIPVSRFALHPVVGTSQGRPPLRPAGEEVERILEVPIADLLDPGRLGRRRQVRDGVDYEIPYFDLAGQQVWGATAMVLAEFVWLLGYRPKEPGSSLWRG